MSKRVRKKSRKLSEAELEVVDEPPKKKSRDESQPGMGQENEPFKKPKRLMVSVDINSLSSKMSSQLKSKPSLTSKSNSPASSIEEKGSIVEQATITRKKPIKTKFKSSKFCFTYLNSNKKKTWRGLKQILQADKNTEWNPNMPTYGGIEAPPPLKPVKKYSDVSGLVAKYTDPLTGLYYSNTEEFETIRTLPISSVQSYLTLRGKATIT